MTMAWRLTISWWEGRVKAKATAKMKAKLEVRQRAMAWRLAIPWWERRAKAKAKVKTQATLKAEAKVQDNDLATDHFLVGG